MHVLQSWVTVLPWKLQSILFSGLRGPDTDRHPAIKQVSRWLRACSQENADPSKPYMLDGVPSSSPLALCAELEFCTSHFVHHLADALRVVAIGHPVPGVRLAAMRYHACIAEELFHFIPEPDDVFLWRHRDKPDGKDPDPVGPGGDRAWLDIAVERRVGGAHP